MSDPLQPARDLVSAFRANLSTVVLGTASAEGEPDASVAGALLDQDGAFVIYISGLAAHTRHLRANPRASVLLVEPQSATTQPFARRRLTFACAAELVLRESAAHAAFVAAFRAKFGATIDLLAGLPDFQFVRLVPQRGRLVAGFGSAFEVDPRDWTQLTPVGRPPAR
ncbi:MAG: pyridoxamine 5'-phosphate oxidase family protein [Verrucomicrobia bacterium]|nr:pyridoxamine 5'-phosphate oxidase family protein [Verrucomicrobiota bacterium]